MNYLLLKYLHIVCVAVSFSLFFVRGFWVLKVYPPATERWVKTLPHVIDGLLLASAVAMVVISPLMRWPLWMQAKIALLVLYVALALIAFQGRGGRLWKGAAWFVGVLVFLYITTVAVLKEPSGIFVLF